MGELRAGAAGPYSRHSCSPAMQVRFSNHRELTQQPRLAPGSTQPRATARAATRRSSAGLASPARYAVPAEPAHGAAKVVSEAFAAETVHGSCISSEHADKAWFKLTEYAQLSSANMASA